MKLKELIEGKTALESLMKKDLPISMVLDIQILIKRLNPELEAFEVCRNKLIIKYGEPTGVEVNGQKNYKVIDIEGFQKEIMEIYDKDIELPIPKIKVGVLKGLKEPDGTEMKFKTGDMIALDFLIDYN